MEFEPYFAHDKAEKLKHYTVSTLSIALTDDVIAEGNPGMTDRILKSLPNCPSTRLLVDPVTRGWPHPIGHLNSFAALQCEGIWTLMRDFIVDGTLMRDFIVDVQCQKRRVNRKTLMVDVSVNPSQLQP
jgi:hypothetical protein